MNQFKRHHTSVLHDKIFAIMDILMNFLLLEWFLFLFQRQ